MAAGHQEAGDLLALLVELGAFDDTNGLQTAAHPEQGGPALGAQPVVNGLVLATVQDDALFAVERDHGASGLLLEPVLDLRVLRDLRDPGHQPPLPVLRSPRACASHPACRVLREGTPFVLPLYLIITKELSGTTRLRHRRTGGETTGEEAGGVVDGAADEGAPVWSAGGDCVGAVETVDGTVVWKTDGSLSQMRYRTVTMPRPTRMAAPSLGFR